MKLLFVNPNATVEMAKRIGAAARAAAPGVKIVAVNPMGGPASIGGPNLRPRSRASMDCRSPTSSQPLSG